MSYMSSGSREQLSEGTIECRMLQFKMSNLRPQREALMIEGYAVQSGDRSYVDDDLGTCQSKIHHRHEALPARQNFGFVTMFGQKAQPLVEGGWPEILERRRLHNGVPS
jgi:hypothetical protein